jgi:hypothetical protein
MTSIRNPRYASADNALIDCEIEVGEDWLPFTAAANDCEASGRDIHARILAGDAGDIAAYEPPEPPPPQPVTLNPRQLRLGLLGLGVTSAQVDAAIAEIPDAMQREAAMIEWRYASEYRRDHPLIASVSAALGIPAATIDAAWSHAATL